MCFRHKEQYSTLFNYHEFNFELLQRNTARKAIFPISRRPEKMAFPKKLCWNIIFFKLSGKIRFFPQKYDLTPRWKMKDHLSKKKTGKYDIFLECSDIISKEDRAGTSSFLYYLESWYFFPENTVFFLPRRKIREMTFLKKYTETWYFLFDIFHVPLLKKLKMILPRRNALKGDWHSRSRP